MTAPPDAVDAAAAVLGGRALRDLSGFNLRNNATYRRALAAQMLDAAAPLITERIATDIEAMPLTVTDGQGHTREAHASLVRSAAADIARGRT